LQIVLLAPLSDRDLFPPALSASLGTSLSPFGIDFNCDPRKRGLRLFRPPFYPFASVFENPGWHPSIEPNCSIFYSEN
jgi:hypothetical protein